MLKRKDYALYHEGDTSSSESESDSESEHQETESEHEERETEEEEEEEEEEEDGVDERCGGWLGPMRCTLCGVLCLSEATMITHLGSKRHRKKMERQGVRSDANGGDEGSGYMELASGSYGPSRAHKRKLQLDKMDDGFEELETHAERLERLRKATTSRRDGDEALGGGSTGVDVAKASKQMLEAWKKKSRGDDVVADAQEKTIHKEKKKKLSGRQRQRQRKQRRERLQKQDADAAVPSKTKLLKQSGSSSPSKKAKKKHTSSSPPLQHQSRVSV